MVLIPSGITVIWQLRQLVFVPGFKMNRDAVKYRQYLQYLRETNQPITDSKWEIKGILSKTIKPREGELDDPVRWITWDEASKYASWRGGRLPSCIEWLRAMKGQRFNIWPDGDNSDVDNFLGQYASAVVHRDADGMDEAFQRASARFDTGEHLDPAVTFADQWEWGSEPLSALRERWDARLSSAMHEADVERARRSGDPRMLAFALAELERGRREVSSDRSSAEWEKSDERPLLGFTPDRAHWEREMFSTLGRSLSGGKIGFRYAMDA